MKIVGLIAEYNPFHNGHEYHIQQSLKETGADAAIIIMSGDYVQRGSPAIMPKYLRAEMALNSGAAAVFELPLCYATGSAELFAFGAVSFLDALGVVDCICFGSESNDVERLQVVADILCEEPELYQEYLRENLRSGMTYPTARHHALVSYMKDPSYTDLVRDPNNILGIEYLKALRVLESKMTAHTIQRVGSHHRDQDLTASYSSATAIRSLLAYSSSAISTVDSGGTFDNTPFHNILHQLEDQVPKSCLNILRDYHRVQYPIYQNDFSLLLKYKLLNKSPEHLTRYLDVSEDLANRICKQLNHFFNFKQFAELIKTKDMTYTRINRALLHIMLGTKKSNVQLYLEHGPHYYARLIGVRKDSSKVLSLISKKSSIPLLSKLSDTEKIPGVGRKMLYHDILASNLYLSVITDKFRTAYESEHAHRIVKV